MKRMEDYFDRRARLDTQVYPSFLLRILYPDQASLFTRMLLRNLRHVSLENKINRERREHVVHSPKKTIPYSVSRS